MADIHQRTDFEALLEQAPEFADNGFSARLMHMPAVQFNRERLFLGAALIWIVIALFLGTGEALVRLFSNLQHTLSSLVVADATAVLSAYPQLSDYIGVFTLLGLALALVTILSERLLR